MSRARSVRQYQKYTVSVRAKATRLTKNSLFGPSKGGGSKPGTFEVKFSEGASVTVEAYNKEEAVEAAIDWLLK